MSPNPARSETTVRFALDTTRNVRVVVATADGRVVRELFSGSLESGAHEVTWDGLDASGTTTAPGVYFVEMSGGALASTKLVRVR